MKASQDMKYTKYEEARIIGARALQISMNAPVLIKLSQEELKELDYDSLKIAELEYKEGVLPITVKRPLPKKIQGEEEETEEQVKIEVEETNKEKVDVADVADIAVKIEGEESEESQ